jgi:hypothetical protein
MAVTVHLMNLPSLAVPHAEQGVDARIGPDREAWIDGLDVPGLGKDLELYDSFGQRITDAAGVKPRACTRATVGRRASK